MILHGDCLDKLREMADNSVDSVVTDPPYGLSFMGKRWDYNVPSVETWREVLRVLKPGGHLLSFGGTRTYHRMVVEIENAGFEIRDQLQWLYGSGFPKSHDVSKAIDKMHGAEREVVGHQSYTAPDIRGNSYDQAHVAERERLGVAITAPSTDDAKKWAGFGTALKPASEIICLATKPLSVADQLDILARQILSYIGLILCQSQSYASLVRNHLASSQSVSDAELSIAQWSVANSTLILAASLDPMAMSQFESGLSFNLSIVLSWRDTLVGLLADASTFTTETASSLITDLKILKSLPWKSMQESIIVESSLRLGLNANAEIANDLFSAVKLKLRLIPTLSAHEPATSKDISLSPHNEPIVLARKPLDNCTIAENVLRYGTGGLNIDASRIASDGDHKRPFQPTNNDRERFGKQTAFMPTNAQGRFPANIILDEEAAAMLDEQSGTLAPRGKYTKSKLKSNQDEFDGPFGSVHNNRDNDLSYGDTGGASRFFYVAKASKRERNEGLEGMPTKQSPTAMCSGSVQKAGEGVRLDGRPLAANQNFHPTVKPIKLMEYLIRLVTPPGGCVLDPFAGSGSTGVAATRLGFKFIGIEMNEEYVAIAEKRIEAAL